MTVITRFAPSPTGHLHVGNIRTALLNWLWARKNGGRFLLRLDDTDLERSRAAYADSIRADLAWLGLVPDGEEKQSARFARYDAVMAQLEAQGRVYPCYETAEELDLKRKVQLSRGLPPVYDRAALKLSADERAALEAKGLKPHWRFRLDWDAPAAWEDLVRGPTHIAPNSLSDPVVRRADGSYLYMLPSVIDDIDMAITHIVRGEDHVTNSGVQIQMFAALGAQPPAMAHVALLTAVDGPLSKRLGSAGVESFRAEGIEPLAICALLAHLGTSDAVAPVESMAPLVEGFTFSHFGRATARFDPAELKALNSRILHLTAYEAVRDRLPVDMDAAAWAAIRPNIEVLADAADWWSVVEGPITVEMDPAERDYLAQAKALLPTLDWQADPWHQLTEALKASTGRKGKALFLPLRLALTGRAHGPDMKALLPLIGQARAALRLS